MKIAEVLSIIIISVLATILILRLRYVQTVLSNEGTNQGDFQIAIILTIIVIVVTFYAISKK